MTEKISLDNLENILKEIINDTKISNLVTKLLPIQFTTDVKIGLIDLLTKDKLIEEFSKKTLLRRLNKDFIKNLKDRTSLYKANLVWDLLFQKNTPLSNECQKVVSILNKIDPTYQNLLNDTIQNDKFDKEEYKDEIIEQINIKNIYIPVNPFSISESSYWLTNPKLDTFFYKKYLVLDDLFDTQYLIKNQNYFHNNLINSNSHSLKRVNSNDILQTTHTFIIFYFKYLKNWILNIDDIDFLYFNLNNLITEKDYLNFTNILSYIIKPLIDDIFINKPIVINIIDSLNINYQKKLVYFIDNNFKDIEIIIKHSKNCIVNAHLWEDYSVQDTIPDIWDELIDLDKKMRKDALDYLVPKYRLLLNNNYYLEKKKIIQDVNNMLGGNWDNLLNKF